MKSGISVAIVDGTTLVGRDVQAVLAERGFPVSKLHHFHSRESRAGLLTEDGDEATFVPPLEPDSLEVSRIAFFCGAPAGTTRFLERRQPDGCVAIDLSGLRAGGAFVTPDGPLPDGDLLLTYDPTAWIVADVLHLAGTLEPVAGASVAIDRPASELGKAALDELFQQAIAVASFRPLPKDVLGTQGAFNVYSPPDGPDFESRVEEDVQRLLAGRGATRPPVTVFSARAGVFHGHHLRIELRFAGSAPAESALRGALAATGGYEEVDPENLSGPVECAGRDETLLLRAGAGGSTARLALAADHLRVSALMAVKTAERLVIERRLLPS